MKNSLKIIFLSFMLLSVTLPLRADDDDKPPEWIKNSTRSVDNGFIVYVSSGEDRSPDRARLRAEGTVIQDLANECSFAPKGARIEDSYQQTKSDNNKVYVKLAIEFPDCDEAKKTNDPQAIKSMASLPMTEELKRYQDLVDSPTEVASNDGPPVVPPGGPGGQPQVVAQQNVVVIHDEPGFFFWRQQVFYEKEVVIMSPPTAYAVGSPENAAFVHRVGPMTQQIGTYERDNPQVRNMNRTWSNIPERPNVPKPHSLAAPPARALNAPKRPQGQEHHQHESSTPHRRRHRF
jgi:hypothetical protein